MYSNKPCSICNSTDYILDFGKASYCPNCFPIAADTIPIEIVESVLKKVVEYAASNKYENTH